MLSIYQNVDWTTILWKISGVVVGGGTPSPFQKSMGGEGGRGWERVGEGGREWERVVEDVRGYERL